MISDEKYDAFKDFYNDREILIDSTDFLKPVLNQLVEDLLNEIDSNKYKFQDQGRFNDYKSERLEYMVKSLSKIVEGIRPTITEIRTDLNSNKIKKDGTRYKPRIKTFQTMGYPLRLQFLRPSKSENDAAKQIHEETEFIDSLIKKIESEKANEKTNQVMEAKNPNFLKLKWAGQKNQLYDVIRQLKDDGNKIENSYAELALFLKQNVDIFEHTALSTIQTELQRGKRPPKSRRINIIKTDQPDKNITTGNTTGELSEL